MKRNKTTLACLGLGLALINVAQATTKSQKPEPYARIAERNVFQLEPVRPAHREPPPRPLAKITLTGTFSFPGDTQALLKVVLPAAPPEPARNCSLVLREGETQHQIRVLAIDARAGTVKVDNDGEIMLLSLATSVSN